MYKIKYRKPEEMKDSGVDWLGKIPKVWDVTRIKNYFSDISVKNYNHHATLLSLYTEFGVKRNEDIEEKRGNKSQTVIEYKKVKRNDIIVNKMLAWMGASGISDYDGVVSPAYSVYRLNNKEASPKYFHYLFRDKVFAGECFKNGWGIMLMRWSVTPERFRSIYVPLPETVMQQKIANFLDVKIAEFDLIISKKEKLIEKLEEAKKSLISEVVTGKVKIVDGKLVKRQPTEMKDSGVEWFGMIPKDWEVKKLGFIFSFKNGINADASKYGKGIKFINVKEVIDNETLNYEQIPNKVTISKASIVENKVKKGDILLNRTSETREELGLSTVYIDDKEVVFGGFVIRGREKSNDLTLKFKKYFLSSYEVRKQIILYSSGSIRKNIGQNALKNVYITFPDYEEQEKISKFLEKKIVLLMSMISKTKTQIQKLNEAKQSLISEAVTGKIDLRDWEIIEGEKQ